MTCFTSRLLYCCLVPSEPFHVEFASYVKDILRREASSKDLLVRPSVRPFIEPLVCFSSNCFCIIDLLLLLLLLQDLFFYIQGVEEKLCFFTIHCNPSLVNIAVQSSQRNASVLSLLLAGIFLYNQ